MYGLGPRPRERERGTGQGFGSFYVFAFGTKHSGTKHSARSTKENSSWARYSCTAAESFVERAMVAREKELFYREIEREQEEGIGLLQGPKGRRFRISDLPL